MELPELAGPAKGMHEPEPRRTSFSAHDAFNQVPSLRCAFAIIFLRSWCTRAKKQESIAPPTHATWPRI